MVLGWVCLQWAPADVLRTKDGNEGSQLFGGEVDAVLQVEHQALVLASLRKVAKEHNGRDLNMHQQHAQKMLEC